MRPIVTSTVIVRIVTRTTIALLVLVAFFAGSLAQAAEAAPTLLPCDSHQCGLLTDGSYPNLVIGRVDHVGTTADMTGVFEWAKAHGYWTHLPSDKQPYLRDVKLVMIALPKGMKSGPVTLFMLQTEYDSAPFHVGDLVRYAPHDAAHDEAATGSPADLALFHGLTGCMAAVCQKGDQACFARYRQGAFTTTHGEAVSLDTGRLLPGSARIDPASLLPVH
jgi:hypothetical protein